MPLLDSSGKKVWRTAKEFDSNGILDCFAVEGQPDAVEQIATDFVRLGRYRQGRVANADCFLFDAVQLVDFGVRWLERRFGATRQGSRAG